MPRSAYRIEALAHYSGLSRLHDTRADRAEIRRQMADLPEGEEATREAPKAAARQEMKKSGVRRPCEAGPAFR
jgi:hypothetical protein